MVRPADPPNPPCADIAKVATTAHHIAAQRSQEPVAVTTAMPRCRQDTWLASVGGKTYSVPPGPRVPTDRRPPARRSGVGVTTGTIGRDRASATGRNTGGCPFAGHVGIAALNTAVLHGSTAPHFIDGRRFQSRRRPTSDGCAGGVELWHHLHQPVRRHRVMPCYQARPSEADHPWTLIDMQSCATPLTGSRPPGPARCAVPVHSAGPAVRIPGQQDTVR